MSNQAQANPDAVKAAIAAQYLRVRDAVAQAAVRAGRQPNEVRLMAVTKTVAAELVCAAIGAGADLLGENKVQELRQKREVLPLQGVDMHLIGHLQGNKVAKAVGCADMIQSVDSLRLAQELSCCCQAKGVTRDILLEVNIGGDAAKFGFSPEETPEALAQIAQFPGISVRGLMTVPPMTDTEAQNRAFFSKMGKLFLDMKGKKMDNISMEILSMGMSADYVPAIAEGSTLVRVGSAIFGLRDYR